MEHHSDFIQTNHGSGWSGPSLDWSRLFETHTAECRIATVNPEHHAETLSTLRYAQASHGSAGSARP